MNFKSTKVQDSFWLRQRKTGSYIHKIGNTSFIFEQFKVTVFKKLVYTLNNPNYLEYCDRIRKIIFRN